MKIEFVLEQKTLVTPDMVQSHLICYIMLHLIVLFVLVTNQRLYEYFRC